MPRFKYSVEQIHLREVHEIPGAWDYDHFRGLLQHLEYEEADKVPEEELKEMACLALSDFEKEEAVEKVLEFRLGDRLSKGQRKNLGNEMQEDPLWVEYSDLSLHEELFHVGCMLFWTFPRNFPSPDIARVTFRITAMNAESEDNLKSPEASFLCRILNDGMEVHNIMNRLFDEGLEGNVFAEAEHILWQYEASPFEEDSKSTTITLYTSWNWVEDLRGVGGYESTAWSDGDKP